MQIMTHIHIYGKERSGLTVMEENSAVDLYWIRIQVELIRFRNTDPHM